MVARLVAGEDVTIEDAEEQFDGLDFRKPELDVEQVTADEDDDRPELRPRSCPGGPALSLHFGIRPWELDRLSPAELNEYPEALADLAAQEGVVMAPAKRLEVIITGKAAHPQGHS